MCVWCWQCCGSFLAGLVVSAWHSGIMNLDHGVAHHSLSWHIMMVAAWCRGKHEEVFGMSLEELGGSHGEL